MLVNPSICPALSKVILPIHTTYLKKPKPGKPESGEYGPKEKMPGVCLSLDEVLFLCAGNTTVGIKLDNATQTCSGKYKYQKKSIIEINYNLFKVPK